MAGLLHEQQRRTLFYNKFWTCSCRAAESPSQILQRKPYFSRRFEQLVSDHKSWRCNLAGFSIGPFIICVTYVLYHWGKNLRAAKHRFESLQKPMGRLETWLQLNSCSQVSHSITHTQPRPHQPSGTPPHSDVGDHGANVQGKEVQRHLVAELSGMVDLLGVCQCTVTHYINLMLIVY